MMSPIRRDDPVIVFIVDVFKPEFRLRAFLMGSGTLAMTLVMLIAYLDHYRPMLAPKAKPNPDPSRPLPVDEVKRFDDVAHRRRLSVKPGLTCLWQVSGRNQISDFREWVRLDLEYIDNWSFWLDLRILLSTIPAVLRGTGAK